MLADGVASVDLQRFMNPCVLLGHGLFLDENRTQLAVPSEGGHGGFVNIPVIGAKPIEDLGDNGGIDGGVKFVGFHSGKMVWAGSQPTDLAGGKGGDAKRWTRGSGLVTSGETDFKIIGLKNNG